MSSNVKVASPARGRSRFRRLGIAAAVAAALAAAAPVAGWQAVASAGSIPPVLTVRPSPGPATYHAGQTITVSVGPNHFFTPFSRVVILQCADPKGRLQNLPKDDSVCDGNTVQGESILVNKDGSFQEARYPLYVLPNRLLSETPNDRPLCDRTHYCVLYVGQNQNNFKAPKLFSGPFTITKQARSHSS